MSISDDAVPTGFLVELSAVYRVDSKDPDEERSDDSVDYCHDGVVVRFKSEHEYQVTSGDGFDMLEQLIIDEYAKRHPNCYIELRDGNIVCERVLAVDLMVDVDIDVSKRTFCHNRCCRKAKLPAPAVDEEKKRARADDHVEHSSPGVVTLPT